MSIVCLLTDDDLGIGEPWEYTPRCSACGRWCREYHDEWNGDRRCTRCALAEVGLTETNTEKEKDR